MDVAFFCLQWIVLTLVINALLNKIIYHILHNHDVEVYPWVFSLPGKMMGGVREELTREAKKEKRQKARFTIPPLTKSWLHPPDRSISSPHHSPISHLLVTALHRRQCAKRVGRNLGVLLVTSAHIIYRGTTPSFQTDVMTFVAKLLVLPQKMQ